LFLLGAIREFTTDEMDITSEAPARDHASDLDGGAQWRFPLSQCLSAAELALDGIAVVWLPQRHFVLADFRDHADDLNGGSPEESVGSVPV
jgi:hypothetical protein